MTNFDLYFGNMNNYFLETYGLMFTVIFCKIGLILTYFLTNINNFDLFFDKYDLLLTDMTNFDLFLANMANLD